MSGDVRFYSSASTEKIRNSPTGETVNAYWKRKAEGGAVAATVSYNSWPNGTFDYRTYGTIILGPGYYDPGSPDSGAFTQYYNNGGDVARTQKNLLLHEFLHWESNAGHADIFKKLELGKRGYDSTNPSRELDKFLANDCKDKGK